MADPLSIIASIAGVATAGVHLANAVYRLSDKLVHAPQSMRDIASNMSLLSTILENLAEVLQQGRGVYKARVLHETEALLDRFKGVQKEVGKIVRKQRGFRRRLGWALQYGKAEELLEKIEALKSALNLVLWTVHLAMSQKTTRPSHEKAYRFRDLVECIVRENRQAVITLQRHSDAETLEPTHDSKVPKNDSGTAESKPRQNMDEGSEEEPEETRNGSMVRTGGVVQSDTATWLYRLVFQPDTSPKASEISNKYKEGDARVGSGMTQQQSLIRVPPAQTLQHIGISSTITNLLKAWTVLDEEEISSIGLKSHRSNADEESLLTPVDVESESEPETIEMPSYSKRRQQDFWDEQDEWTREDVYAREEERRILEERRRELTRLKEKLAREEEEARLQFEQEQMEKEWELKKTKEEANKKKEEEERKRMIAESMAKLERAELEAREARARAVAEFEAKKAKERAEYMHEREKAIAEHEKRKHEQAAKAKAEREALIRMLKEEEAARAAAEKAQWERFLRLQKEEEEKERERRAAEEAKEKEILTRYLAKQKEEEEKEEVKKAKAEAAEKEQFERFLARMNGMSGVVQTKADDIEAGMAPGSTITPSSVHQKLGMHKLELGNLPYDVARELIDVLFDNTKPATPKTYQSLNGEAVHTLAPAITSAERALEELNRIQEKYQPKPPTSKVGSEFSESPESMSEHQESDTPETSAVGDVNDNRKILFASKSNKYTALTTSLSSSLAEHRIQPLFEIKTNANRRTKSYHAKMATENVISPEDTITGSLLWNAMPVPGTSELFQVLCEDGWKPIYVRATDAGQTWFHGRRPLHVRFLRSEYVPQFEDTGLEASGSYLLIGSEWIEEDALRLAGTDHTFLSSGFWMLDPAIDYDEIISLIATSFMLREAILRKAAKKAVLSPSIPSINPSEASASNKANLAMNLITGIPERLKILDNDSSAPRNLNVAEKD